MPRKVRDYADEYKKYHSSAEQKKNRAARNSARRAAVATHGKAALAGKDVDHKKPLSKGGSTAKSNTRVISASKNRSYARNSKGGVK
jgi:hypothetical protein